MADTWAGTTDAEIVTGNCVRDAGVNGIFTVSTIPSGLNKKGMTKTEIATYTSVSTGSFPLSDYTSNQLVSKSAILGTF